jgi:RNA polymerase sigma-70 factor (ECF subfamily)
VATVDQPLPSLQAGSVTPARDQRTAVSGTQPARLARDLQAGSADAPRRGSSREERRLVTAAQAGSEEALEVLFRRHWPDAHRAAYLIVRDAAAAEDIAQEGFLAALRALGRFDRRRPFRPWLHRIVVNRAIDHSRARALRREVGGEALAEAAAEDAAPLDPGLLGALADLSGEQRAVIVLRYLLEYTPGEIGSMLGLPRGTVNSRIRRGLDQLAATLEEER